jgi:hypothetical protein
MERRKIIIYAIFSVTVLYGIYFHFLSGDSKKSPGPAARPSMEVDAAFALPMGEDLSGRDPGQVSDIRPGVIGEGHRNPFLKKNTGKESGERTGRRIQYTRPNLSAISAGGPDTFVIANGRVLKIGDSIGAWKLLEAENGRALFAGPEGPVWIDIGG